MLNWIVWTSSLDFIFMITETKTYWKKVLLEISTNFQVPVDVNVNGTQA